VRSVHVVVLNWNGKEDTARCLDSLARLEKPAGAEIVTWVVDNGSADGSMSELPPRFPWARFLAIEENLRYAGGNNRGLQAALAQGADFVLFLNNDTEASPSLVARLLAEADTAPHAGLLGPCITDGAGRVWFAGGHVSCWMGWTWHEGMGRAPESGGRSRDVGYLTGCCLLGRREALEKLGGFDEGYYLYAEDTDLCLRAQAAGWTCRFVPAAHLVHYVSSSSGGAVNPFKAYQRTRAGLRLFSRHARGAQRLTWPLGFLALLGAHAVKWTLAGRPSAAMAGFRAVIDAGLGKAPGEAFPVPPRPRVVSS
jgi:GT2 family glycosyltransferase